MYGVQVPTLKRTIAELKQKYEQLKQKYEPVCVAIGAQFYRGF